MSHTYTNIFEVSSTARGTFLCENTPDDARFAGAIQNFSCAWVDPWLARHGLKDGSRFAG